WVAHNRLTGVQMAVSGGFLMALAIANLATRRHPIVPLHVVTICIGALLLLAGVSLALRRRPVLAADERGIVASSTGIDRSLLPWEVIDGADAVGKKKSERYLVLLTGDVEEGLRHVHPSIVKAVRKLNERWKRPGVLYIPARLMADPP